MQPSIEEIMSTDYPFAGPEYSSDNQITPQQTSPIEYPLTENSGVSATSTTRRNHQIPMQLTNDENSNDLPLQQSQYTAREYDAANMLINYRFDNV